MGEFVPGSPNGFTPGQPGTGARRGPGPVSAATGQRPASEAERAQPPSRSCQATPVGCPAASPIRAEHLVLHRQPQLRLSHAVSSAGAWIVLFQALPRANHSWGARSWIERPAVGLHSDAPVQALQLCPAPVLPMASCCNLKQLFELLRLGLRSRNVSPKPVWRSPTFVGLMTAASSVVMPNGPAASRAAHDPAGRLVGARPPRCWMRPLHHRFAPAGLAHPTCCCQGLRPFRSALFRAMPASSARPPSLLSARGVTGQGREQGNGRSSICWLW